MKNVYRIRQKFVQIIMWCCDVEQEIDPKATPINTNLLAIFKFVNGDMMKAVSL